MVLESDQRCRCDSEESVQGILEDSAVYNCTKDGLLLRLVSFSKMGVIEAVEQRIKLNRDRSSLPLLGELLHPL
jgi:hypothetical protein